jgi:FkbM family methyltransferase
MLSELAQRLPRPVYRRIRRYRTRQLVRRFATYDATHTYGGIPLTVHLADPMSADWYDHDWDHLAEIAFLKELNALRAGATVFDLGAHQAVVALVLAHEAGADGRVIAVEAEPHNVQIARRNVQRNPGNVTVIGAAVADRAGTLRFAEGLNGRVDESTRWGTIEVPAITIDQLAAEHGIPDVVMIDVEGYEGRALHGATTTLRNGRTVFCVEVHVTRLVGSSVAEILEMFPNFTLYAGDEAPAHRHGGHAFRPLPTDLHPRRFFLVAVPKPD